VSRILKNVEFMGFEKSPARPFLTWHRPGPGEPKKAGVYRGPGRLLVFMLLCLKYRYAKVETSFAMQIEIDKFA
jgi:hypothetical protein